MVNRVPPVKAKPAPLQKFYKGDQAVLNNDIILRDGLTLLKGKTVTVLDVEPVARYFQYLVEILETEITAWVMEVELHSK